MRPIPPSHHPHLGPASATSQWVHTLYARPPAQPPSTKTYRPTLPRGDLGSRKCVKPVQLASCVAARLSTPFRVLGSDPFPLMPRRLSCRELLGMGSYWDCACKVSAPKGRALALHNYLPIPWCVVVEHPLSMIQIRRQILYAQEWKTCKFSQSEGEN